MALVERERRPIDAGLSGLVFEPPFRLQEFDQRRMRIDLDQPECAGGAVQSA